MVLQVTLRSSCSNETPFLCIEVNASITEVPMMNTNLAKGLKTALLWSTKHILCHFNMHSPLLQILICAFVTLFALVNQKAILNERFFQTLSNEGQIVHAKLFTNNFSS